jgi:sigma-54-specific transcriptional regulator
LSPDADRALLTHTWPGNIRELENTIHRALIVSDSTLLNASAFAIEASDADAVNTVPGPAMPNDEFALLAEALNRVLASKSPDVFLSAERVLVTTAFEYCGGNQVRTARRLGISRNILRSLLKRHGLLSEEPRSPPIPGGAENRTGFPSSRSRFQAVRD